MCHYLWENESSEEPNNGEEDLDAEIAALEGIDDADLNIDKRARANL